MSYNPLINLSKKRYTAAETEQMIRHHAAVAYAQGKEDQRKLRDEEMLRNKCQLVASAAQGIESLARASVAAMTGTNPF